VIDADLIQLFFGGMHKLGPGSDDDTRQVLHSLPRRSFSQVVDAGCGSGRQSLVLASELNTLIHAVDSHAPFLHLLQEKATEAGIENLIQTHCMDMADIPKRFQNIDLLWSEAAAYSIGFGHALHAWRDAIAPEGFLVISELCWLRDDAPARVRAFFEREYPDMQSRDHNLRSIRNSGYHLLSTHTLPRTAWSEGYYEILEPRARGLLKHPEAPVREFAAQTLEEIEVFDCSADSYGYMFYALEKA
jgi:trans-aconitate methyltransferase